MPSYWRSEDGPPMISKFSSPRRKKKRLNTKKEPPPESFPRYVHPKSLNELQGPDHLVASSLPEGFPPEMAFRALAAYSLLRTLSIELRLSPFTPNVFLRALMLPFPNRLMGQIHVSLLRVLLPALRMGYCYRERGGSLCVFKKRHIGGLRWELRAGDNLTYLDAYTWPLFYDDYVHLTADDIWARMHDDELHTDFRHSAFRDDSTVVLPTKSIALAETTFRRPGQMLPTRGRAPEAKQNDQLQPPLARNYQVLVDSDSEAYDSGGSEFGASDVEPDIDEDFAKPPAKRKGRSRKADSSVKQDGGNGSASRVQIPSKSAHALDVQATIDVFASTYPCLAMLAPRPSPSNIRASSLPEQRIADIRASTLSGQRMVTYSMEMIRDDRPLQNKIQQVPSVGSTRRPGVETDEPPAKRMKEMVPIRGVAAAPGYHQGHNAYSHTLGKMTLSSPQGTGPLAAQVLPNLGAETTVQSYRPAPGADQVLPSYPQPIASRPPTAAASTTQPVHIMQYPFPVFAPVVPKWNPIVKVEAPNLPSWKPAPNMNAHAVSWKNADMLHDYLTGRHKSIVSDKKLSSEESTGTVGEGHAQQAAGDMKAETSEYDSDNTHSFFPDTNEEWPQFTPVEIMRNGVPYHRLQLEQKTRMLEFLLDELLTIDFIAAEFTRREAATSCFDYPYGALPTENELESLENEDECGLCGLEGELLCCDGCIRSYHHQCVSMKSANLTDDKWLCPECTTIDPSQFGPLRAGRKASLDWFTLSDVKVSGTTGTENQSAYLETDSIPVGSTMGRAIDSPGRNSIHHADIEDIGSNAEALSIPSALKYNELLVVHGFLFSRPQLVHREIRLQSMDTEENWMDDFRDWLPATRNEIYDIVQGIGSRLSLSWPLYQIPLEPSKVWSSALEPEKSNKFSRYFLSRDSFDPSSYFSLYRTAPLPHPLQVGKGSKRLSLVLSDFESECHSSDVRVLSNLLTRDMSQDHRVAMWLKSSTQLFNPYQLIRLYLVRLEASLRRGCLLGETSGIRNDIYRPENWSGEVTACSSIYMLAKMMVHLVDACHSRVFLDGWFDVSGDGQGKSDSVSLAESSDPRNYAKLPIDWTADVEMACRRWQRALDSNIPSLLSGASIRLEDSAENGKPKLEHQRGRKERKGTTFERQRDSNETREGQKKQTFVVDDHDKSLASRGEESVVVAKRQASGSEASASVDGLYAAAKTALEECFPKPRALNTVSEPSPFSVETADANVLSISHPKGLVAIRMPGSLSLSPHVEGTKIKEGGPSQESPKFEPAERTITLEGLERDSLMATSVAERSTIQAVEQINYMDGMENNKVSLSQEPSIAGPISMRATIQTIPDKSSPLTKRSRGRSPQKEAEKSITKRRRSGRQHRTNFTDTIESLSSSPCVASELVDGERVLPGRDKKHTLNQAARLEHERRTRLAKLEDLIANPTMNRTHWPVAGRTLFDPIGHLPPMEMRRLGRNAGAVVAPYVRYSSSYEVGQVSVYHSWRKRSLNVRSFEDLLMQIRVLDSFIDKPVLHSCEALARRSPKVKSQVQKVVLCKQRDLATGTMYYFVVNKGTRRGLWVDADSIDLSSLVLERSNCINVFLKRCAERAKKEEAQKIKVAITVPKAECPPSQVSFAAAGTVTKPDLPPTRCTLALAGASPRGNCSPPRPTLADCTLKISTVFMQHQTDTEQLITCCKAMGFIEVPVAEISKLRSKNALTLKDIYSELHEGRTPTIAEEARILSLLSRAEEQAKIRLRKMQARKRTPQTKPSSKDGPSMDSCVMAQMPSHFLPPFNTGESQSYLPRNKYAGGALNPHMGSLPPNPSSQSQFQQLARSMNTQQSRMDGSPNLHNDDLPPNPGNQSHPQQQAHGMTTQQLRIDRPPNPHKGNLPPGNQSNPQRQALGMNSMQLLTNGPPKQHAGNVVPNLCNHSKTQHQALGMNAQLSYMDGPLNPHEKNIQSQSGRERGRGGRGRGGGRGGRGSLQPFPGNQLHPQQQALGMNTQQSHIELTQKFTSQQMHSQPVFFHQAQFPYQVQFPHHPEGFNLNVQNQVPNRFSARDPERNPMSVSEARNEPAGWSSQETSEPSWHQLPASNNEHVGWTPQDTGDQGWRSMPASSNERSGWAAQDMYLEPRPLDDMSGRNNTQAASIEHSGWNFRDLEPRPLDGMSGWNSTTPAASNGFESWIADMEPRPLEAFQHPDGHYSLGYRDSGNDRNNSAWH